MPDRVGATAVKARAERDARIISKLLRTAGIAFAALSERRVPYWPEERWQAARDRRVQRIVRHAYETVPFYRAVMRDRRWHPEEFRTVTDLARLPLIDGAAVRRRVGEFRSTAIPAATCMAAHSGSGSSTLWDRHAALERIVLAERDRVIWARLAGGSLLARQLYIVPPHSSAVFSRRFYDRWIVGANLVARRCYVDPAAPYTDVMRALEAVRPHVVRSYGSYLEHFARYAWNHGVRPSMPPVWTYGADAIAPHWRELIERELGCRVVSNYGSTEAGRIGFECEHRTGYHLNTDVIATRIVRPDGSECEPGEVGEVVVSNLLNRATVLLNFRLGDRGAIGARRCPCGRTLPLLTTLEGRVSETVTARDGQQIPATVLLVHCAADLAGALEVQLVPRGVGRIMWRIAPAPKTDRSLFRSRLVDRCAELFGSRLEADVEYVSAVPRTVGGKRHLVSEP